MNKLKKFVNKVKGKLKIRKQDITIFIFALIVYGFYQVLKSDPSTRDAILAFATVIMAFAAFWAIQSANSREENRQKFELNKEDRERKERLLNEIIEWAIDVAKCEFSVYIKEPPIIFSKLYEKDILAYNTEDKFKLLEGIKKDQERNWKNHFINLHRNYQTLDVRGEHILSLSNIKDFKSIFNSIHDLKTQICNYLDTLWKYMEDMKNESKKDTVNKKAKDLNDRAIQVIREATEIKIKDVS